MPKKIRNLFYKNLTFEKLLEAHRRARKHKAYRKDVIKFELNLENNLKWENYENQISNINKIFFFILLQTEHAYKIKWVINRFLVIRTLSYSFAE